MAKKKKIEAPDEIYCRATRGDKYNNRELYLYAYATKEEAAPGVGKKRTLTIYKKAGTIILAAKLKERS